MDVAKFTMQSPESQRKEPLRVLFVGFTYVVGIYQSKLKSIQDTGYIDVVWLAPRKWKMYTWNWTISLEIRYKGIHVYPANIRFLNGVNGGYLYPTTSLLNAIHQFKPDILHYEQEVFSLSAFQSAFWANFLRIPFTVFCWENVEKRLPFYRWWTTKFVLDTASAIVVGNADAAKILQNWGYKRKIAVMPQIGVDTNLFFPRHQQRSDRVFTIGYLGRLIPEKGIDLILDAVKQIMEQGINLRIIICGSGRYEPDLRAYADQLGISDHILWLGAVSHDDIPEMLTQVDVLVLPSRTLHGKWKEQFGHVLIEAMAMGIPVIGSDSGQSPR